MTTHMAPTRDVHSGIGCSADVDGTHREERGERLQQTVGERSACPDEEQSEPEHQAGRPKQQLHNERGRTRRSQDRVLTLICVGQTGNKDEAHPHAPVDLEAQSFDARWPAREDHGQDDVAHRHHDDGQSCDRCDDGHLRPACFVTDITRANPHRGARRRWTVTREMA